MPELPEVETIVRELQTSDLIGKTIVAATVYWPRTVSPLTEEEFCQKVKGQKILSIMRRGKWIFLRLSEDNLYVHLRMTGKMFIYQLSDHIRFHAHERLKLELDDGRELRYEDQRKFGRWRLGKDVISGVGLEPLSEEFKFKSFKKMVLQHSQKIKAFLLNQKYIAGLGNIYVDEALWEAKIHPKKQTNELTAKELKHLYAAIPKVLMKGIESNGTTLGNHRANYFSVSGRRGENQHQLNVFRREGERCFRCGEEIIKITLAQRGTHICPKCQKM